ncbi:hypothetical protein BGX38DRAFT_1276309 [Terfezia claveryi]|nr:hypothetical protein BGX38DRAFT_1276309 [Terfezia claveryi]
MTTNGYPIENVLGSELLDFLNCYDEFIWDAGTRRWTWMSYTLTQKMLDTLVGCIVDEWMLFGITRMIEFETVKGMNLDEIEAMVEEQVTDYLAAMGLSNDIHSSKPSMSAMATDSQDVKGRSWIKDDVERFVAWMEEHQENIRGN